MCNEAQTIALSIKPQRGGSSVAQHCLTLRRGLGIEGDAHAIPGSPAQVLLVSAPVLAEFGLQPGDLQENILINGAVEDWRSGQVLQIGSALVRLTSLCEPCDYLETLRPRLVRQIIGRRGRLGIVMRDGRVQVGDDAVLSKHQFPPIPDDTRGRFNEFVARIPSGKVVCASDLLLALGLTKSYYRTIPILIKKSIGLPVHRLVARDGSLSRHIPNQAAALAAEGVEVVNGKVSIANCWAAIEFHDLGSL